MIGTLRRVGVALVIAAGLIIDFTIAGLPVYVVAPQSAPQRADAVMVIGPALPWRIAWARQLVASGNARTLVVSVGDPSRVPVCAEPGVICFRPSPYTTQGEARELARLMKENHWTTATVITSTPHVLRARMRMTLCVPNGVQVVGRPTGLTLGDWAYQYVYQTAGFFKAFFVTPGC